MRSDKESAIVLRKSGLSYKEIETRLRIPKSTLSTWFAGEEWSERIREKLAKSAAKESKVRIQNLNAIRGNRLAQAYATAGREAEEELHELQYNPLFIAGLMLYWGEGDKVTKQVTKLINTDPNLVKLFTIFLTKACRIPERKLKASLILYPDLDKKECLLYWSRVTGIPREQFIKSSVINGRHKTKRLSKGMCIVYVSSSYFKTKMLHWLDAMPKKLMSGSYYENI